MKEKRFAALVTVAFGMVAGWGALHHEMWRDELQAWLIARDSATPLELLANLRYEGHPALWHLCLWPLTRLTRSPVAMQVLHLAIATGSVAFVARWAPFTRAQRVLLALGYFSAYEYSVLARNYALSVLLLFVIAALYPRRAERPLAFSVALALLAQTSVHALIVAGVFGVARLLELVVARVRRGAAWGGVAIVATGGALSLAQIAPPSDAAFAAGGLAHAPKIADVLGRVPDAFLPVPPIDFYFWGNNALEKNAGYARVEWIVALAVLAWAVRSLARARAILAAYIAGTASLLAFFWLVYFGDIRHHGFLFVLFVASAWAARARLDATFTGLLALHVIGATIALAMETRYVFSSGKRAAAALARRGLVDAPMVAEPDYAAVSVLAYSGKRDAYSPRTHRAGSFVVWNKERANDPTDEAVVAYGREVACGAAKDAVVLLNHPLEPAIIASARLEVVAELYDSMIPSENFYVYLVACAP